MYVTFMMKKIGQIWSVTTRSLCDLETRRLEAVACLASYPGVRGEGRRKRTPGTHCLRMRLISEESRKIGYFRNPPHNVDANFNNH